MRERTSNEGLVDISYFADIDAGGWYNLPRKHIVGNFLARINKPEQVTANRLAQEFHIAGRPLARTVPLIPIAAHQEAPVIRNAITSYAQQETDEPFSLLLYPNAPTGANQTAIDDTMDEIEKVQKQHPELDLRVSSVDFYDRPTIGTIRRSLWNGALLLSHYEGAFDDPIHEVIGINNDIDTVRQSPRNIKRVQNEMNILQSQLETRGQSYPPLPPRTIRVKHAYDPAFPNASLAAFWYDFTNRQHRPHDSYMAGLVVPFSYYAEEGGIPAGAVTHEMAQLSRIMPTSIPGTTLETSPRRIIGRLSEEAGLNKIWTDDSFGATNECRDENTLHDITHDQLEYTVSETLDDSMRSFFSGPTWIYRRKFMAADREQVDKVILYDEFVKALDQKKRLASAVLTRVMNLPELSTHVERFYDTRNRAKNAVRPHLPAGY